MNPASSCFVGIDVTPNKIVVARYPDGDEAVWVNDDAGVIAAVDTVREIAPTLVVAVSVDGLETSVVARLAIGGIPIAVVGLRQVREFSLAVGGEDTDEPPKDATTQITFHVTQRVMMTTTSFFGAACTI